MYDCATFSKSLNHRNIGKSVSDIRIRIRFLFEGSFWMSVSGCKLTILLDIQLANRIVIISANYMSKLRTESEKYFSIEVTGSKWSAGRLLKSLVLFSWSMWKRISFTIKPFSASLTPLWGFLGLELWSTNQFFQLPLLYPKFSLPKRPKSISFGFRIFRSSAKRKNPHVPVLCGY